MQKLNIISYLSFILYCFFLNSCEKKDDAYEIVDKYDLIFDGMLYGGGSEGLSYPGLILYDIETYQALLKEINKINPILELNNLEIDFSRQELVIVADSIRVGVQPQVKFNFIDLYHNRLKIYFQVDTSKKESPVAYRQAINVIRIPKMKYQNHDFVRN